MRGRFGQKLRSGVEAVCLPSQPITGPLSRPEVSETRTSLYVPNRFNRFDVDLRGTFEDYLKEFSRKPRREPRCVPCCESLPNSAADRGSFREYSDAAVMPDFYDLARSISQRTYQHQLLKASLPDTPVFSAANHRHGRSAMTCVGTSCSTKHIARRIRVLYCPAKRAHLPNYWI